MHEETHNLPASTRLDALVRLRQEVRFLFGDDSRENGAFIEDGLSGRRFTATVWQVAIAEKLNGRHSLRTLRAIIEHSGRLELEKVDRFFEWLWDNHLLETIEEPKKIRSKHRRKRVSAAGKRKKPKIEIGEKPVEKETSLFGQTPQFMMGFATVMMMSVLSWRYWDDYQSRTEAEAAPVAAVEEQLPGTIVKSECHGVLSDLLVSSGDAVRKGDVMARIENPDDITEIERLRREIGLCRVRRDRSLDDPEARREEVMKLASLTRQLGQHQATMEIIEVTAPVTGVVVTAESCNRLGGIVEEGDVLMSVISDLPEDPSILAGH